MLLLGLLFVSVICAEREYFHITNPKTWDDARRHCQACYKDLTTITPGNTEVIGLNITSDYWIGLRQNMSGSKFWSRWANGDPVLFQNWYPGHPVLKKNPEPLPTCPKPSPSDVMHCPAFTKLCACLNSSVGNDDFLLWEAQRIVNTSEYNTTMWCPALANLCDCLNSTAENETSVTKYTNPCSSSPSNTTSSDLEPKYIADSCVALLSFGMWQEKQCNNSLPYICYDDRFYGEVNISNQTQREAFLSWGVPDADISQHRIKLNEKQIKNLTNETSYQITSLDPGELYNVQVIPVRCDRDLNAQNISFYTLPEEIRHLTKVKVETNVIDLSWEKSRGTNVSYLVNTQPGNIDKYCNTTYCSITNLQPGQMYNFTVKAVVNETSFGTPGYIPACTKPSKPIKLTSSNNATHNITATWDSPDNNSLPYTYKITLDDKVYEQNSTTITMAVEKSGSTYTLKVLAIVPGCSEPGEAAFISAYTTPMPVTNLQLKSYNDSITATWDNPNGNDAWFNLTIFSPMSDITSPTVKTSDQTYTFKSLKTAVLYTISVIAHVGQDLNPSQAVSESTYTKPNSPGKAMVKALNSTAVNVSWEPPVNSQGVTNITYSVKYGSDFWNDNENLTTIGNTSVIIGGLKSGTKYKYGITVWAGDAESEPSVTSGLTEAVNRLLTIAMLCSSSTLLYCMNNSTENEVLIMFQNLITEKFADNIFWNITLHKEK